MFLIQTALKDLRRHLRDPLALALWMGIPLAIGGLISLAFGGSGDAKAPQAHVWVTDLDDSLLSGLLYQALASGAEQGLPITASAEDLATGKRLIEDGDGSAWLVIPEGFGEAVLREEACVLRLTTNPAQRILPSMVEETLQLVVDAVFYVHRTLGAPIQRIIERSDEAKGGMPDIEVAEISVLINQSIGRVEGLLNPALIQLELGGSGQVQEASEAQAPKGPGFAELFFPSMLFMALFFIAQGISEDFWVEKDQGTLRRALVTPHHSSALLAGKLLGASVLIGVVGVFGLLTARYAFGVEVQNFGLAALWAAFAGAWLLLMMIPLQLYASSQQAGGIITHLVMMPLMMMGGAFFPFEMMPDGMAAMGRLTPNGWVLSEFKNIMLDDYEASSLGLSFVGLVLVGSLLFLVANRRLSRSFGAS